MEKSKIKYGKVCHAGEEKQTFLQLDSNKNYTFAFPLPWQDTTKTN